jgi:hypothetical protein
VYLPHVLKHALEIARDIEADAKNGEAYEDEKQPGKAPATKPVPEVQWLAIGLRTRALIIFRRFRLWHPYDPDRLITLRGMAMVPAWVVRATRNVNETGEQSAFEQIVARTLIPTYCFGKRQVQLQ